MAMTKREAWNYALGICKVDGGEPDEEFLELVEQEIRGEISCDDIHQRLIEQYTVKLEVKDAENKT
jgi:hypothetical protein